MFWALLVVCICTTSNLLVANIYFIGPLFWGPISEVYGRTRPLFIGFALFVIFNIPVAVAQNVETIMLARFLGGCFGAAPIAIVAGLYVDIWDNSIDRGTATAAFAGATFLGKAHAQNYRKTDSNLIAFGRSGCWPYRWIICHC